MESLARYAGIPVYLEPSRHSPFYSVTESAGLARNDPQTVRRWLKSGELTEYHAGRMLPGPCC